MKKHYSTRFSVNLVMSLLLATCFATNLSAVAPPEGCPPSSIPGYTYAGTYGGSTYFVSNFGTNGTGAIAAAAATGGHLATIADAGENAFVANIAGGIAWIGINDQAAEGNFVWGNGEPVTYTNWYPGEPSDYFGAEDWTIINWYPGGTWNDFNNLTEYSFPLVLEFSSTGDDDCDDVANECDVCPGGDDSVDNNHDGIADCSQLLSYAQYGEAWKCASNKLSICHLDEETGTRHTICVSKNAVSAHLAHGDWAGPCVGCAMNISAPIGNGSFGTADHLEMELTPNPASNLVNVRLHGLEDGETIIVVYDQLGKVAFTQNLEYGTSQVSIDLSTGMFSAGLYFVRLTSGQTTLTERLVVAEQ